MSVDLNEIEQAEDELEQWLVDQAKSGVPEVVLIGILRDYADDVEQIGHIPRMWGHNDR